MGPAGRDALPRRPHDPGLAARQRGRGEAEPRRLRLQPERGGDPEGVRGRRIGARQVDRPKPPGQPRHDRGRPVRGAGGRLPGPPQPRRRSICASTTTTSRTIRSRATSSTASRCASTSATRSNKPLFVGETGIIPNDVGGTLQARADALDAKLERPVPGGHRRQPGVGLDQARLEARRLRHRARRPGAQGSPRLLACRPARLCLARCRSERPRHSAPTRWCGSGTT